MEYYFGDVNYPKDDYIHKIKDKDNYLNISEVLKWNYMKKIWKATFEDVIEASKYSSVFEISEDQKKIRKSAMIINNEFKILGLDKDSIRELTDK